MVTDETLPEVATEEMAGVTNEVGVMTGDGEITTVGSETTVVEIDSNVARSTITIGPVRSARTPISPSEMSATDAKPLDRAGAAVAAVDEIAPTVVDETTTVGSAPTVVDETTTVGSETTVVDETTEATTDNEVERSPTTIGPARSVRIPISHSEMSATGVRNLVRVAAVVADAKMTVDTAPTATNEGRTTVAEAAMVVSNVDARNKAVVVLAPNIANPQMFNLAELGGNAQAMHTINHRAISGHSLGSLSAKMTERT